MRRALIVASLALGMSSLSFGGDGNSPDGGSFSNPQDSHILSVFDSHGTRVGPVLALGEVIGAVLSVNGVAIYVPVQHVTDSAGQVSASRYIWSSGYSNPIFPSSDCGGPPFVVGTAAGAFRPTQLVRQGSDAVVYIAPDTYSTTITTAMSYFADGQCLSGSSLPPDLTSEGWTPETAYALTQHYPEPLTIHY